ncbi:hypothetical protein ABB37_03949 [Leptomonas pyrrhocoris]|uniref:Uncharacterized protein n=1 Tax=Leptomonas pyrrhocoris TaxID=157538 RepID=A0A0N0VFM4_LEPPY|nr:hypothetical protein ABB37_03949 [Leptomonas pyrrhocoris]KPA81621.1 hypothetical protein ABB37_03949 [Leptomonas pyrrhocoris]|eukprot:XP_015660060.1 hypothetical protein ABB37_03949 [Leptomonas pyrrhocoris]
MYSNAATFMPSLPAGTDVPLDECFPIDDVPARSPHCISWGPHNILQVCTRWSISFHLTSLLTPARQLQIRHHPLCHRTDVESMEVVVGAKWSTSLMPEVFYPASARLCAQTTSNLVVYRVSRNGTARVKVSYGIGIACCRGGSRSSLSVDTHGESASGAPSERVKPSSTADAGGNDGDSARSKSAASRKRKPAAKTVTAPRVKRTATTAAQKRQRRRGKESSDESESEVESTSTSSSSSSHTSSSGSDSDSGSDSEVKTSRSRAAAPKRGDRRAAAVATSSAPADNGNDRGGETAVFGATRGSLHNRTGSSVPQRSSAAAMEHETADPLKDSDTTLLDYTWLSNDELVVLSSRGLHVVPFYGELSDDESPQVRNLPPPVYTWNGREDVAALGFAGSTPTCFAPTAASGLASQATASTLSFLKRTLVVASPYLLRVVHIPADAPKPCSPAAARLLHYVEVPALLSVPTAVCAVAVALGRSTGALSDVDAADIIVFLAAPSLVLRGRFTLVIPPSTPSAPSASLRTSTWTTDAQFGPDQLVGEISLRALLVAPFAAEVPTALTDVARSSSAVPAVTASTTATSSMAPSGSLCTAVVGVGERALFQYLLSGPSCVTLFQCPLLAGHSEMPARRCAGVTGVALHPAGSVAVVAVQSGHTNQEPVHLWPVTIDDPGSWLRRFVELAGVLREQEGEANNNRKRDAPSTGSPPAAGAAAANNDAGRSYCDTRSLLRSQVSDAFFLRERLLGGSTAQSGALHRYAHMLQETFQMPSHETLKQIRAFGLAREAAARLASPLIADLHLRRAYLQLRAQYGLELFLRWPLPLSASESDEQEGCVVSLFASLSEMESKAMSWPWWRLLRHIWASCPWDKPVLHELILSNAIRILAKRHGYANMAVDASERFRERAPSDTNAKAGMRGQGVTVDASKCSTDPDTVDVDGARCYVEAYVRRQEEMLNSAAKDGGANTLPPGSSIVVLTAADCEPPALRSSREKSTGKKNGEDHWKQVHWCISQAWVSTLKDFLACVAGGKKTDALLASPPSSSKASSSPAVGAREQIRFPCSLCDRDSAVMFRMSLSSTSHHVPLSVEAAASLSSSVVAHTTLFSGTTFSPLSFFSPDYVLTRCFSCGLSDYADGPLCRVCGGLLE